MNRCILVATDGRPEALGALRMARWLAAREGSPVEVLTVYEPVELYSIGYPEVAGSAPPQVASLRVEALRARAHAQLAELGGGATGWPLTIRVGSLAPTIARFAAEKEASLILLGLDLPDGVERWLGREALLRLVHLTSVPVLAVPPGVSDLPRQVIAAVDFSDFSLRAAHEVLRWAAPAARLHLVHVCWGPPEGEAELESMESVKTYRAGAERRLEELAAELEAAGEVNTRVHVLSGDPGREILRLAEEIGADLIATGSHGTGFFGRIVLGSVSSKLVHGAPCSLLIAPPVEAPAELPQEAPALLELTERELLAGLGTAGDLALSNPAAPAE